MSDTVRLKSQGGRIQKHTRQAYKAWGLLYNCRLRGYIVDGGTAADGGKKRHLLEPPGPMQTWTIKAVCIEL